MAPLGTAYIATRGYTAPEAGPVRGVGARVFLVDDDAVSLPEWREVVVEGPAAPETDG